MTIRILIFKIIGRIVYKVHDQNKKSRYKDAQDAPVTVTVTITTVTHDI